MPTCPACQSPLTLPVAEHYRTQVRLPETDPEALAPFAPPLRRALAAPGLIVLSRQAASQHAQYRAPLQEPHHQGDELRGPLEAHGVARAGTAQHL